nr:BMC domain-containing protein [uncultured Cohaesibacter sp.]
MSQKSLGLIETTGLTAAIEAADAAVKSANVELIGYELAKGGGMTTVKLYGEVGAVNAAIDAAKVAAAKVNKVVSTRVIARPADGMEAIVITKETVGADLPKPPEPPEPTPPTGGGDGPKSGPDNSGEGGSDKSAEATGEDSGDPHPAQEQSEGAATDIAAEQTEDAKSQESVKEPEKTAELALEPVAEVKSIESAKPKSSTTQQAATRKTGRGRRRRA